MQTSPAIPREQRRDGVCDPVDPTRPHPARRYDYWLGGKTNFAADRASADAIAQRFPTIRHAALANRAWLHRVVTYLAQHGIRQFLDIGTGIPTAPHVHEIAQRITPTARVVYVDNDPVVLAHARALMTSPVPSTTAYVQADLRRPETIMSDATLRTTLDLDEPVALLLVAVLHFLADTDDPYTVVSDLLDALPPGSYLAISHCTLDALPAATVSGLTTLMHPDAGHGTFRPRTSAELEPFVDGLHLVEPGLRSIVQWRPDTPPPATAEQDTAMYGVVARLAR